jgi:hypothetical protein
VVFRGRGELDCRRSQQGRTENCQNCPSHRESPFFRALGCEANWPLVCQRLVGLDGDGHGDSYDPAHHEAASKFIGQRFFGPNIRQANGLNGFREVEYALWTSFGRSGSMGRTTHGERTDEEACSCHSPDRIAGMGANQIAAQERDGACRSLCAHWPDRGRQTGLFDEVRKFAGPAATASAGRSQSAT